MPYEQSSAKKKRIMLNSHRKNTSHLHTNTKQIVENPFRQLRELREEHFDQDAAFNCASINNSLQIFDEDPKNRHFQFYDSEEDYFEQTQGNAKNREALLQTMPSTINMHKKIRKFEKQSNHPLVSKIPGVISLCSIHTSLNNQNNNKTKQMTPINRKFLDLTLIKQGNRLSHHSSTSSLTLKQQPNISCRSQSSIFQKQKSILSTVSLNSVQFTMSNSTSERKKVLTITCHKYDGVKGSTKMKTESISKCKSIKIFRKFT